jgi:hypothetical protein
MANYGPPGGGPAEPWRGRRPDDAYGPPAEPQVGGWGDQVSPYPPRQPTGAPEYQPYPVGPHEQPATQPFHRPAQPGPQYPADQYRPADPYAGDPYAADPYRSGPTSYVQSPPERNRGKGPLITVLAVLAVLVLGGAATVFYLLGRDDSAPSAAPTAPATEPTAAAGQPVAPVPTAPAPESSADPRFVKVGQCVRNEGPNGGKPKLLISGCSAKSYEVLRRFDGATSGEKDAEAKCAKVDGYTNWYFFDSELDTLDFVLCLKQR